MARQMATVPIIQLPKPLVILPRVLQRITISSDRPDFSALLATLYTQASSKTTKGGIETVPIACVPTSSSLLGPDGQLLIQNGERSDRFGLSRGVTSGPFAWGVAAKVTSVQDRGNGEVSLIVEGTGRVRVEKFHSDKSYLEGTVVYYQDEVSITDASMQELFQQLQGVSIELVATLRLMAMLPSPSGNAGLSPLLARRLEIYITKKKVSEAGVLADFMANLVVASFEEKLQLLALVDVKKRVAKVIELLDRQVGVIKNNTSSTAALAMDPSMAQKLIERLRSARQPLPARSTPMLGSGNPMGSLKDNQDEEREPSEIDQLEQKLKDAKLSPEAAKVAQRDLKRLKKMVPQQAEYSVVRTYLETLAEIPWTVLEDHRLDAGMLQKARKQLDDDHFGLEKVKKRILEYLAVLRLKQSINDDIDAEMKKLEQEISSLDLPKNQTNAEAASDGSAQEKIEACQAKLEVLKSKRHVDKSPILLFVGPPGVGKTSLARSIATALGRKFHRISLGGVRDEAEIRGHRITYVAARPGLIAQGLRKVGVANPVFLLDEIDKLGGSNFHGDPSAAMLEVLDPEQNNTFTDHYINLPLDLSKVLFIATANSLETIPPPLLDRMEMIEIPAYTTLMKREIASRHLLPKQLRVNGLGDDQVVFSKEVVSKIIESYTRESGVRNLERELGSVCRAKAVEYADAKDAGHAETYSPRVTIEDLERILGIEKYEEEIAEKTSRPGIVTGLVAYSSGGNGSILFIEVADMPGSGTVQLTGKLGDVLKESVEVALSWVKAHAYDLGLAQEPTENIMKNRSIHVHCPAGAIPKDGPSSGMAQAIALISLFSGKTVPPTMAMTGEISLRGRVTAVGGIKEKLIGALRAGVKTVLLPAQNKKDVRDLPQEVMDGLEIIHVSHIWEAIRCIWPDSYWPGEKPFASVESRL